MSKRLQIVLSDDEYRAVADGVKRQGRPVDSLVRESLRRTVSESADIDPEQRIAAVLRFARFAGPTGDIEQILAETKDGRGVA